ncbi:hypothetical protein DUI87_19201 [Hirundo rustica rustica]|uniref:Uncharacterized protein n=1 Tax=Hirundo rustica rustica TaxID=333673 RepID=A0A3M0JZN9_HIRRU|nr:hypothetical protein DUI87_19201 [Hirundo rustica rustica]
MTQTTRSNTVQTTLRVAKRRGEPNPKTPSQVLQIPKASAASPSAGAAGAGRSSKRYSALSKTDSDDKEKKANPKRERGQDTPSKAAKPGQAEVEQAEAEQARTKRGRNREYLESATPKQQTLRSPTPPISSLGSEPPACRDSETDAELLQIGARPKISQILQMYPELKISYKKSTSSNSSFKQKLREPLLKVKNDEAAEEDQDMSITNKDIIRITASESIPVRKV